MISLTTSKFIENYFISVLMVMCHALICAQGFKVASLF